MRVTKSGLQIDADGKHSNLAWLYLAHWPGEAQCTVVRTEHASYRSLISSGRQIRAITSRATDGIAFCVSFVKARYQLRQRQQTTTAALFEVLGKTDGYVLLQFVGHLHWQLRAKGDLDLAPEACTVTAMPLRDFLKLIVIDERQQNTPLHAGSVGTPGGDIPGSASLLYQPPFNLANTLARRALRRLFYLNTTPFFAYSIYELRDRLGFEHAWIARTTMALVSAAWFIAAVSTTSYFTNSCRKTAVQLHYGTAPSRAPAIWIRMNAFMEAWDVAITADFAVLHGVMTTAEELGDDVRFDRLLVRAGSTLEYLLLARTGKTSTQVFDAHGIFKSLVRNKCPTNDYGIKFVIFGRT